MSGIVKPAWKVRPGAAAVSLAWVLLATGLAGCGGVVTVRHVLPADLPGPARADALHVGAFTAAQGAPYAERAAKLLLGRLEELGKSRPPTGEIPAGQAVTVSGEVYVQTHDARGTRIVRRRDPETERYADVELPTLVRTATVRVDFTLTGADGRRLAGAETRAQYDSLDDPRVRGELGLARPADPAKVPPVEQIADELLAGCVDTFVRMVRPPVVTAPMKLRGTLNADGGRAVKEALEGNYEAALPLARAAAAAEPKNADLLLNLAIIEELCGELDSALGHYTQLANASTDPNHPARSAVQRVRRVRDRLPPVGNRVEASTQVSSADRGRRLVGPSHMGKGDVR